MTKSARQDTTKAPADPTETESAATQATEAGATEAGADQEPQADAAAETEAADDADKPDLDETKRKFREILERKHQAHNDAQGNSGRDGSKISSAHGPAASRRSFRRKSG